MEIKGRFDFLGSNRFWAAVIAGLGIYGETKGWIGEPERNLIATIMASFIAVGTIDRAGEKIGGVK